MLKDNQTKAWSAVFDKCIADYHLHDEVDAVPVNPYPKNASEHLLYEKNWIDTVQWHLEDIIRDPAIAPAEALILKRRIDSSNQKRTDLVEQLDDFFYHEYREVVPAGDAKLNTETPAWAIDRLSILALKIFHMQLEAERENAAADHREKCAVKLNTLLQQREDLHYAIETLLTELAEGKKVMKLYRQMKMYNDETLNPILYKK